MLLQRVNPQDTRSLSQRHRSRWYAASKPHRCPFDAPLMPNAVKRAKPGPACEPRRRAPPSLRPPPARPCHSARPTRATSTQASAPAAHASHHARSSSHGTPASRGPQRLARHRAPSPPSWHGPEPRGGRGVHHVQNFKNFWLVRGWGERPGVVEFRTGFERASKVGCSTCRKFYQTRKVGSGGFGGSIVSRVVGRMTSVDGASMGH